MQNNSEQKFQWILFILAQLPTFTTLTLATCRVTCEFVMSLVFSSGPLLPLLLSGICLWPDFFFTSSCRIIGLFFFGFFLPLQPSLTFLPGTGIGNPNHSSIHPYVHTYINLSVRVTEKHFLPLLYIMCGLLGVRKPLSDGLFPHPVGCNGQVELVFSPPCWWPCPSSICYSC